MMKRLLKYSATICGLATAMAFAAPAQMRSTRPPIVAHYKLTNAWPVRLTIGGAAAGRDSAATTTVELAYEKMKIVH
jgi:ABC-type sugar transport system substrate-binding protein